MKVSNQKGVTVALCPVDEEVPSSLNAAARFRRSVKNAFCLFFSLNFRAEVLDVD